MSTILLSFFFSSRRRHTRSLRDWSSDVCSSDLSAKVITSAAIIMVVVFAIFATTGVPQVKEIGLGLAVAIALDRSEERRVGKECGSRWAPDSYKQTRVRRYAALSMACRDYVLRA